MSEKKSAEKLREEARAKERKARNRAITESAAGQLAIFLHDQFCSYNHTDGCTWKYEKEDGEYSWGGGAHERWLKRARNLLALGAESDHDLAGKMEDVLDEFQEQA